MSDYWAEQEYTCAPTDPNPIDTEALRRLADAAMVEPPWEDAGEWQTDGYAEYVVVSCEQDSDGEYDHVAEAANEHLGAFIAATDPNTVRALLDALEAAEHRATQAEADRDEWKEVALQERGAALDALEQIKAREARIKAVQALTDQADAAVEPGGDPRYSEGPMLTTARIRRALEE